MDDEANNEGVPGIYCDVADCRQRRRAVGRDRRLHVTAKDPKGAVVKNATVTLRNEAGTSSARRPATSKANTSFSPCRRANTRLPCRRRGSPRLVAKDVTITVGQKAELPVTLQVAAVESVVNVSTEPELVETQRTAPHHHD